MITFSRVLLAAFALAGLLYSTTVNSSIYMQVTLYVAFAFAFVRAISSEPFPTTSIERRERAVTPESTESVKRAECSDSNVSPERATSLKSTAASERDQGWR